MFYQPWHWKWWQYYHGQLLSHPSLSPLSYCFKLIAGFVDDRPIALCHFFLVAYLFWRFKVDCCMFTADFGKMAWKRWVMQVLHEKWKSTKNSPFLTYEYPHFLPSSREVEGVREQSWKGQKWPCSSSWIVRIRRCPKSKSMISQEGELSGVSFLCRSDHIVMSAWL